MQFDPVKHTKEYLLNNSHNAYKLARESEAFASSVLANDYDVLSLKMKESKFSIAHTLAIHQPLWALQPAANNYDVLAISTNAGETVAAKLAQLQRGWVATRTPEHMHIFKLAEEVQKNGDKVVVSTTVARAMVAYNPSAVSKELLSNVEFLSLHSMDHNYMAHYVAALVEDWKDLDIAKSTTVLSMKDDFGNSVAHELATHQPDWIRSKEAQSDEILKLANDRNVTVANTLARCQPDWDYTGFASSIENLKAKYWGGFQRPDSTFSSLAHDLAENPRWAREADAAYLKEILIMTASQSNGDELSVAEVLSVPLDEKISRVIKTGAAFMPAINGIGNGKFPDYKGIRNGDIKKSVLVKVRQTINEFIEGVQGSFAEVKLRLAMYQTFCNLKLRRDATEKEKAMSDDMAAKEEANIQKLVLKNPQFISELAAQAEMNPEIGGDLIRRLIAQHHFSAVVAEPDTDPQHQEAPGFY